MKFLTGDMNSINLLRWSFFTLIYNRSSKMNYFIYFTLKIKFYNIIIHLKDSRGEKYLAITSEDSKKPGCFLSRYNYLNPGLLLMIVFLTKEMVPKLNPFSAPCPSLLTPLSLINCASFCNFIPQEEERPRKLLQIVASFEYLLL